MQQSWPNYKLASSYIRLLYLSGKDRYPTVATHEASSSIHRRIRYIGSLESPLERKVHLDKYLEIPVPSRYAKKCLDQSWDMNWWSDSEVLVNNGNHRVVGRRWYCTYNDISPPRRRSSSGKPLTLPELNVRVDEVNTRGHSVIEDEVTVLLFSKILPQIRSHPKEKNEASIDSDSQSSVSASGEESKGAESEQEIEGDFEWVLAD